MLKPGRTHGYLASDEKADRAPARIDVAVRLLGVVLIGSALLAGFLVTRGYSLIPRQFIGGTFTKVIVILMGIPIFAQFSLGLVLVFGDQVTDGYDEKMARLNLWARTSLALSMVNVFLVSPFFSQINLSSDGYWYDVIMSGFALSAIQIIVWSIPQTGLHRLHLKPWRK